MKISALNIYPVKSCAAISLSSTEVEPEGLIGDRRMMLIDEAGKFITQRSHAKLAQINPSFNGNQLSLHFGGRSHLMSYSEKRQLACVWRSEVDLLVADDRLNGALSKFLGESVRLVKMDGKSKRMVNPDWGSGPVSLADGYPILVTTTASLKALSREAGRALQMEQFRPNVVIDTEVPWVEDGWRSIQMGSVTMKFVKPCTRCVVTTLNPDNGEADRPETMQALIQSRRSNDDRVSGVLFGWNAVVETTGSLSVNMPVEILKQEKPWPIKP